MRAGNFPCGAGSSSRRREGRQLLLRCREQLPAPRRPATPFYGAGSSSRCREGRQLHVRFAPCELVKSPFSARIQDFFEKQEQRINELADTMDAMNTKLDTIMAALGQLSAGPEPTRQAIVRRRPQRRRTHRRLQPSQQHDLWAPSTDASCWRMQRLSSGASGPCGRRLGRRTRPRLQRRGTDLRSTVLVGFVGDQSTNNVI